MSQTSLFITTAGNQGLKKLISDGGVSRFFNYLAHLLSPNGSCGSLFILQSTICRTILCEGIYRDIEPISNPLGGVQTQ